MTVRSSAEYVADLREWAARPDNRIRLGLFDDDFRGVAPGETLLLIGGSYVGKTNLLMNIIVNRLDTPQLFVSLEMPARQVVQRLVAILYDTPYRRIEDGIRTQEPEVLELLEDAVDDLRNVYIIDTPCSLEEIESEIAALDMDIELVSIDYLELLGGRRDDPLNHVVLTATELKDLAKRHDLGVICLHQPRRGEGWKPLTMFAGRYGGETQVDYVLGVYRPSLDPEMSEGERYVTRGHLVVQMLKNRDGVLCDDHHFEMDTQTVAVTPSELATGRVERDGDSPRPGIAGAERPQGDIPANPSPVHGQLDMHYDAVYGRKYLEATK